MIGSRNRREVGALPRSYDGRGGCRSIVPRRSRLGQTPRAERSPSCVLPADTLGNVSHLLIHGCCALDLARRSENVGDRALGRSPVILPFRQQPRRDVRPRLPQSQIRLPRAARGSGPGSKRRVRRVVHPPVTMMMLLMMAPDDSFVDPFTHLVLEVRVALPHEFSMISAGPLQLPKHQLDVSERLAILRHSLRPVLDPVVSPTDVP